jgi:preprotein translocase subunit SecA
MGKAFPDDLPLEAKMVSKAIERAQHTVEDRNFEIRKDVLKYDEVMNEQRKVIYRRRQQILEGGDLRDESILAIEGAIDHLVQSATAGGEFSEDWDVDELLREAGDVFPVRVTREQLGSLTSPEEVFELLNGDALEQYEAKEQIVGAEQLREIERRVMLSVIDQHWREHLYEMDYLREGINLRAMGQRDPLAEWQREGFDMFEAMMESIKDDFVRYVFRLEVVADDAPRPVRNLRYSAPEDPVQGSSGFTAAAAATPPEQLDAGSLGMEAPPVVDEPVIQRPVKVEKTPGRNEPCFCGSGKKYKLCHGKNS